MLGYEKLRKGSYKVNSWGFICISGEIKESNKSPFFLEKYTHCLKVNQTSLRKECLLKKKY